MTTATRAYSAWFEPTTDSRSRTLEVPKVGAVASTKSDVIACLKYEVSNLVDVSEGFEDIGDVVARSEANPRRAAALAEGRRVVAGALYSDSPRSIIARRLQLGLSQQGLADVLGTSQSHIARIETGGEDIRLSTIRRLAAALNLSPGDVVQSLIESAQNAE